jgi:hypothetical protein
MKAKVTIAPEKNGSWTIKCKELGIETETDGDYNDMLQHADTLIREQIREEFDTRRDVETSILEFKISAVFGVKGKRPETPLAEFLETVDGYPATAEVK